MMAEEAPRSASSGRRRLGNKPPLKNEDAAERKAALEAAIRKKIECERKALQVVEHLLEDDITEELFVDCGRLITPSHYMDVVEERFIIKLCGYPLCQNKLQNVPKQKYKISTKTNKVYDITERKRFCSNFCYKASKYFEGQISKTPVWLREEERPPTIELLKKESSGYSGKEIKLVSERIKALDIENPAPAEIHHDSDSGSESNSDAEQDFVSSVRRENLSNTEKLAGKPLKSILKKSPTKRAKPKLFTPKDTLDETSAQLNKGTSDVLQEEHGFPRNIQGGEPCHSQNVLENAPVSENLGNNSSCSQVVFLGVSQKGADQFKRLLAKSKLSVRSPADSLAAKDSLLESLCQTFTEWRSEETLKLLHGSCSTSSHLVQHTQPNDSEKEELDEDDLENASSSEGVSQKHTLNSLDQSLPFQDSRAAAKPLPSFEHLKKETLQLELKVSEFYKGKFTVIEEDNLAMQSEREQQNGKSQDNEQWAPILPLVDSKAQQLIRTRIVLEKLQKALPAVLGPLKIPFGDVYSELRNLVKTFRLTNRNIIHKAPVWTLITIVLLSILSENIPAFAHCQQNKGYTQFLATLLEELCIKTEDLESLTKIFKSG
ncbi:putative RNA polymerase II subunit B1 CTD phosphatase RPAP2 isoform X2 [Ahaetulla prasina]|uniref:putative RNA polymerase II subunit B1 CTD phosphatase RPAP2 isoform X2 n=1 Tax=Ahaetulla prasina TaxID=499056 RepID=UPI002647E5DE|nr:putative RNA polymerase II subunit B1 CTD phosphatase RPAP2 isoform X2 [Ahaetulla prasina]XP_058035161.1 putative RNA polymerase II subunit B1 CTD phosphatase RPAP2 isoform X2 [Ahaetulla prasina]